VDFLFTDILATSTSIPEVALQMPISIFYLASDKHYYLTGKLVRGNCTGSSSIQLLTRFAKIKCTQKFMIYSNSGLKPKFGSEVMF